MFHHSPNMHKCLLPLNYHVKSAGVCKVHQIHNAIVCQKIGSILDNSSQERHVNFSTFYPTFKEEKRQLQNLLCVQLLESPESWGRVIDDFECIITIVYHLPKRLLLLRVLDWVGSIWPKGLRTMWRGGLGERFCFFHLDDSLIPPARIFNYRKQRGSLSKASPNRLYCWTIMSKAMIA